MAIDYRIKTKLEKELYDILKRVRSSDIERTSSAIQAGVSVNWDDVDEILFKIKESKEELAEVNPHFIREIIKEELAKVEKEIGKLSTWDEVQYNRIQVIEDGLHRLEKKFEELKEQTNSKRKIDKIETCSNPDGNSGTNEPQIVDNCSDNQKPEFIWMLLEEGEEIKEGDEVYSDMEQEWMPAIRSIEKRVKSPKIYRRKINLKSLRESSTNTGSGTNND